MLDCDEKRDFCVNYVEEMPSWPIQGPNKGRNKKALG